MKLPNEILRDEEMFIACKKKNLSLVLTARFKDFQGFLVSNAVIAYKNDSSLKTAQRQKSISVSHFGIKYPLYLAAKVLLLHKMLISVDSIQSMSKI